MSHARIQNLERRLWQPLVARLAQIFILLSAFIRVHLRPIFFFSLLLLTVGCRSTTAQEPALVDWRFGIIETYESPTDADSAGASWTRVQFHWGELQPNTPGEWQARVSDEQITAEINAGREVTGLLIGIPNWARDDGGLPAGLHLPPDDPNNLWANFVRQAIDQYPQINHWTIWNEPDIWDENTPGHTWNGTVEDFLQLQRTAYLVAKETNPDSIIHLSAFTYFWDANYGREQYFNRLLDAMVADPEAEGHNYYFDIATAHLYFQPNLIFDILTEFQQMMLNHGIEKPIWLVETNAPPIDDPIWPVESVTLSVLQQEQAAFMPQALASALSAGAERVGIFKLIDTETDRLANPEPFGLVRQDGSRRPVFDTYQVAIQYLAGVQATERERWNEVGQIRLDQADFSTTVVFARLPFPQTAQVPATANEAVLVDMWGKQTRIQPQDGVFNIDLPAAVCTQPIGDYCMIGGLTYYVIQATTGELPISLPAPSYSPTGQPFPTPTVISEQLTVVSEQPTEIAASPTVNSQQSTETPAPSATSTQPPAADNQQPAASGQPPTASYWLIGAGLLILGLLFIILWGRR